MTRRDRELDDVAVVRGACAERAPRAQPPAGIRANRNSPSIAHRGPHGIAVRYHGSTRGGSAMGMLVDGQWHDVWYDTKAIEGPLRPQRSAVPQLGHGRRQSRPFRPRRLPRRAEPLSPICRVRVPVGAPHADLSQVEGARDADRHLGRQQLHGQAKAGRSTPGPDMIPDSVNRVERLYELYTLADPTYSGRATIPMLWDKHERTIVSNESSEIIRMFNSAFDAWARIAERLLSGGAARRDRRDQRVHLSERQQRRVPRRLRNDAGSVRGSGRRVVRRARTSSKGGSRLAAI